MELCRLGLEREGMKIFKKLVDHGIEEVTPYQVLADYYKKCEETQLQVEVIEKAKKVYSKMCNPEMSWGKVMCRELYQHRHESNKRMFEYLIKQLDELIKGQAES